MRDRARARSRSGRRYRLRVLKRELVIAAVAGIAIIGSGVGLYLRFGPLHHPAAPVATIGARTVSKRSAAEVLTVVKTTPDPGATGAALNSPIDLEFNLPVDPSAVQTYFSVLPATPGTFAQGPSAADVTFTPANDFAAGSSVNVVVRRGLASRDGAALQGDFSFNFVTEVAAQGVMFQANGEVAMLVNAQAGHAVPITVQLGNQVPADVALKTYKASSTQLLQAFVHSQDGTYSSSPIDTSAMQLFDTKPGVKDGSSMTVSQPDGIYLLLAADGSGQYGTLWLDFSKYGVLLRQDDQAIVVAGQDLGSNDTSPNFNVTFYNLLNGVQQLSAGSFAGTASFPLRYPQKVDLAIASTGGEDVVVPVSAPATNADIKVVGDLSTQAQIYVTTDRAGYQKGETVKFAGIARWSNDQQYVVPANLTVAIWAGSGQGRLVDQRARVAANGTFSGSFVIPDGAFNLDGSDAQLTLYADAASNTTGYSPFFTVIQALGQHQPAARISVSLDKSSYTAGDQITASISASDNAGHPLANQRLSLSVYSTAHPLSPHEIDNFPSPTSWGVAVQQNVNVQLDGNGHASYSVGANVAQKAADQEVTIAASYGSGATAALGARAAVVYQANDDAFLLTSRLVYQPGSQVIAPFVVEDHSGNHIAGLPMAYEFDKTDYQGSSAITTVVASGSITTDAGGMGSIRTTYNGPTGAVVLRVKGRDASGNTFQDERSLNVVSDPTQLYSAGASDTLLMLSVTSDKIAYHVNDVAHLDVTSPAAQPVFMSLERGRIHSFKWINLVQGDNSLDLPITQDLAPGFTLTFSYFHNGTYVTEGLPIELSNSGRLLKVTVTPDQAHYTAGQTAHLSIAVTDANGAPMASTLLLDGYDANMSAFKMVDQASLPRAFLSPALRGTNASSSLLGLGNWGGRCGGGGNPEQPATTNPGQTEAWLPGVTTDSQGHATVAVPVGQSPVRVALFASTAASTWGQAETELSIP